MAARIADPARPLDLVANNAGFGTSGNFVELDVDRLGDEIAVNVDALTRLSHAALAAMTPRGRGWLLNTSSFASFQPAPRLAVYAATKAYVTSLSESLHEEAAAHGVVVTALCPGGADGVPGGQHGGYNIDFPAGSGATWPRSVRPALEATAKGRALSSRNPPYKSASWDGQSRPAGRRGRQRFVPAVRSPEPSRQLGRRP